MVRPAILGGYGARLAIEASEEALLDSLLTELPAGWVRESGAVAGEWRFRVHREQGLFRTIDGAGREAICEDMREVRRALGEELRRSVGHHAPGLTFVHAGVVALDGAAMVLPGHSFAGKSTLVGALVRAGAEFYSDEYAIFDRSGRVTQYREPLIRRDPDARRETEVAAQGPDRPLPVKLVVVTAYRRGAVWEPRRGTRADGILALAGHAIAARERPAETLAVLSRAVAGATVLAGERGEVEETAAALLATLASAPS